ncbi:MAG: alpha/beta hydrolase [bacterium]|nr:alpha/beta hydrolase [bacterium]
MEGWIRPAAEAWRQLFDGELESHPVADDSPELETLSVRRPDYRPERGNWPRIIHHGAPSRHVLVLIHGLKDSPGYLEAIALRFAAHGANVALPLLQAHGRRDPVRAMRAVDWRAWRATGDRAVEIAAMLGEEVSIGGLSTGGALALDKCLHEPSAIAGKLFLFSAALALRRHQRLVLSTGAVTRWLDARLARRGDGIGGDPYKYSRDFFVGARQVYLLTRDLRRRAGFESAGQHRDRVFVAHSVVDRTISISAVEGLVRQDDPGQHHIIPAALDVAHAELVLAEPMTHQARPGEPPPPRANPEFDAMMIKALAFLDR